jgi:hypothetical protein
MIPDLNFVDGYFHVNDILKRRRINPTNLEFHKLRHWGFIEAKIENKDVFYEDKDVKQGIWRLTEKGKAFVEGKIQVEKHVFIHNKKLLGYSEERTGIKDALGDKFYYTELMNEPILE